VRQKAPNPTLCHLNSRKWRGTYNAQIQCPTIASIFYPPQSQCAAITRTSTPISCACSYIQSSRTQTLNSHQTLQSSHQIFSHPFTLVQTSPSPIDSPPDPGNRKHLSASAFSTSRYTCPLTLSAPRTSIFRLSASDSGVRRPKYRGSEYSSLETIWV